MKPYKPATGSPPPPPLFLYSSSGKNRQHQLKFSYCPKQHLRKFSVGVHETVFEGKYFFLLLAHMRHSFNLVEYKAKEHRTTTSTIFQPILSNNMGFSLLAAVVLAPLAPTSQGSQGKVSCMFLLQCLFIGNWIKCAANKIIKMLLCFCCAASYTNEKLACI